MAQRLRVDFSLIPGKKKRRPGYWLEKHNHVTFLDQLWKKLGLKRMEDWYEVTLNTLIDHGANGILSKYSFSPSKMLLEVYPNHDWIIWKFKCVPQGFWDNAGNRKEFLNWLEKQMYITKWTDWYRISQKQISKVASTTVIQRYGMMSLLKEAFPQWKWDLDKLSYGPKKASQRMLGIIVQKIFPDSGIIIS
jgi:hypothetical protein